MINLLIILVLTILILLSYGLLEKKIEDLSLNGIYQFITGHNLFNHDQNSENDSNNMSVDISDGYRAVWLTYMEFKAFRKSVKKNDKAAFTTFYKHVLDRCKKLHINHIIVQVRPFSDALYKSDYYPWAECISGEQGKSPGYDPLKIMTELTHKNNMKIEAWINPYRVALENNKINLSNTNPARKWMEEDSASGNVLEYDHDLYYNPASKQVRNLIYNGVEEILNNYDVDGIHMDDYFYPIFNENNYDKEFDAVEYIKGSKNGNIPQNMTLAEWRRYNVNQLVSGIYKRIKKIRPEVTFGISPAGEPDLLRSNLAYYADIDTWLSKEGYIDYIMPQIYWGYTNEEAPFDKILEQWVQLCHDSPVRLYAGLQLYRMGLTDKSQSDYQELQKPDMIKNELNQISKDSEVDGYCFFSFQYLDPENNTYDFDSQEFSDKRKKILKEINDYLESDIR